MSTDSAIHLRALTDECHWSIPPSELQWVRPSLLRGLVDNLSPEPADYTRMLREAGLPSSLPIQAGTWPLGPVLRLWQLVQQHRPAKSTGPLSAAGLRLDDAGVHYMMRLRCYGSAEQALENLPRDGRLITNACRYRVSTRGAVCSISLEMDINPAHRGFEFLEWTAMVVLIRIIQFYRGEDWHPEEIRLMARCSHGMVNDGPLDGVNIRYGQSQSILRFPLEVTRLQPPALCSQRLLPATVAESATFTSDLKGILLAYLVDGYPSISELSQILGIGARSIQRRLAAEGCTYSGMIQEIRSERALELLQDPQIRVLDIARELGYEDASHFSRAFRRATGVTPTDFRRKGGCDKARCCAGEPGYPTSHSALAVRRRGHPTMAMHVRPHQALTGQREDPFDAG